MKYGILIFVAVFIIRYLDEYTSFEANVYLVKGALFLSVFLIIYNIPKTISNLINRKGNK